MQGSRFADIDEIKSVAAEINCADYECNAGGVPLMSDGKIMFVANQDAHSAIFGATGSKKSRNIIMPTIDSLIKSSESMVIVDPKGELYKRYGKKLKKHGYAVTVLNFRETGKGSRWNPLSTAYEYYKEGQVDKSTECIRDIMDCLFSELAENTHDAYWEKTSKDYGVGLALLLREEACEEAFTLENIRLTHSQGDEKYATTRYINEYYSMLDKYSDRAIHISGTVNAPNDTRASVHSVFSQPFGLYLQENLRDMMCESDIELSSIGLRKSVVFLITPDERSAYNPIIATFIKICYGVLIDTAHNDDNDGVLPVRVNFILDEFCNLPAIPDFSNMISAARSRNIRFNLVIQNLSQLYKNYSEAVAETIISNCEIWFVLRSNDYRLHERVKVRCGNYISEYSGISRPLVDTMNIQRLDKKRGEVLILMLGQYPFITELPDIDEYFFKVYGVKDEPYQQRIPKERTHFDFQEMVKNIKKMNLEKIMKNMELKARDIKKKEEKSKEEEDAFPDDFESNFLTRRIVRKMEELDVIERKLEDLKRTDKKTGEQDDTPAAIN